MEAEVRTGDKVDEEILAEEPTSEVGIEELYDLSAADPEFYGRVFFPRAFRQASPDFHKDFWAKLLNFDFDFFGAEIFRGGAKTTLARICISYFIAFAISRNILNICISEDMAVKTSRWLKKQVEGNSLWTSTFGLEIGDKWTDTEFQINHIFGACKITVIAKGMTSGLRGLNIDDYRPDFIYLDDICDESNTKTEESLKGVNDLVFGAIVPSLAPKSEASRRKLVLTQTSLNKDDPINRAHQDPTFLTVKYPKLMQTAEGLVSAWPARWTTEECVKEKADYVRRRQLHVYLREFGCKITGSGQTAFEIGWLRDWVTLPKGMTVYIGIDPARASGRRAHKTALFVIGIFGTQIYVLDYFCQKGQNPEQVWVALEGFVRKWRPFRVGVETIAYQQVLSWYIKTKMQEFNFFFPILEVQDRRSKDDRIVQSFSGPASGGQLYAHPDHTEFRENFEEYAQGMDIDLLDAGAQAITLAQPWLLSGQKRNALLEKEDDSQFDPIAEEEKDIAELDYSLGAP